MDKNEDPCGNPQAQPGRPDVPAQRHKNAHHHGYNQNGWQLVKKSRHCPRVSYLGEAKFSMSGDRRGMVNIS
jgi:hypothetical protein